MTPQLSIEFIPTSSLPEIEPPAPLPAEFTGRGEVKGFLFRQLKLSNAGCIYEVSDIFGNQWYEVFKIVINRRFNRIAYPKSNAFGKNAWTTKTSERALERLVQIATCFESEDKPTSKR